ncbi:MAG: hypothetical protein U9R79_13970 [Armatimonadota bacterium]|nr:hypothetical protein [Armatimonadota bacterium]
MMRTPWTRVIGEKLTVLQTADIGGDEQSELLAGTKSGAVHVLNVRSGEPLARVSPADSPVQQILSGGEGALVVHADGEVREIRLAP